MACVFRFDMGKAGKKRPKGPSEKQPKKAVPDVAKEADFEEKPFDFGGIPNRDLKKNLGCG